MILLAAINSTLLRTIAQEQRQAVTMTGICVPEFVPGHGDAVRTSGEIQGAVTPIQNIQMVEPDVARPGRIDGIRGTLALTFTFNRKVLHDDIITSY